MYGFGFQFHLIYDTVEKLFNTVPAPAVFSTCTTILHHDQGKSCSFAATDGLQQTGSDDF